MKNLYRLSVLSNILIVIQFGLVTKNESSYIIKPEIPRTPSPHPLMNFQFLTLSHIDF